MQRYVKFCNPSAARELNSSNLYEFVSSDPTELADFAGTAGATTQPGTPSPYSEWVINDFDPGTYGGISGIDWGTFSGKGYGGGVTIPQSSIKAWIICVQTPEPDMWLISFNFKLTQRIYLAPTMFPDKKKFEGAYGHEQRHVVAELQVAEKVDRMLAGIAGPLYHTRERARIVAKIGALAATAIMEKENEDGAKHFPPDPPVGVNFPPMGVMPVDPKIPPLVEPITKWFFNGD